MTILNWWRLRWVISLLRLLRRLVVMCRWGWTRNWIGPIRWMG